MCIYIYMCIYICIYIYKISLILCNLNQRYNKNCNAFSKHTGLTFVSSYIVSTVAL